MQIQVDTHTHTYASGHAYSTLMENVKMAKEHGLKMFCTTDHSSAMPGSPHYWFFNNQRILPRFIDEVAIIRGVETNIMNVAGEVDLHPSTYEHLDWVIASFHEAVFKPMDKASHTEALLNIIKSGKIDALGHLGNPNYDFDFEAVAQCAKQHNVAIELNNSSLKGGSRAGSEERCAQIARVVKAAGGFITTGSDAHFCTEIGVFEKVSPLLDDVQMPTDKVITHTPEQFLAFLALRGRAAIVEFDGL
ncbi:phosphatase [Vibrio sp. S11_S32]|uniref:phosphatase n=1 Tax=Vibrio sp. S11_S32 TaxID=2720225 RepID=UPI0016806CCD|nr:phosphatase [Vibrio sp. S11_S32]MBD1577614.1 phosphatase [Vibrio sp. S11_S32]